MPRLWNHDAYADSAMKAVLAFNIAVYDSTFIVGIRFT